MIICTYEVYENSGSSDGVGFYDTEKLPEPLKSKLEKSKPNDEVTIYNHEYESLVCGLLPSNKITYPILVDKPLTLFIDI